MAVTNPWLSGPAPKQKLAPERLGERILNLLSSQNMCVLATSGPDGPLATPVRYYHLDFALMFTASAVSPKMRNIAADPGSRSGFCSAGRAGQQPWGPSLRAGAGVGGGGCGVRALLARVPLAVRPRRTFPLAR